MDFLICYLTQTPCNFGDSLITYFKEIMSMSDIHESNHDVSTYVHIKETIQH